MACATPVVGVKEGGLLETIQDKFNGRLTPRDEKIFSMALLELIKNPQMAREYGQNGYHEVLTKWNWDSSVQNIEQNLLNITKSIPENLS
jgi:glycosyltransferase involved in cell wall biosynthesis